MRILLTGDFDRDEFAATVAEIGRIGEVVRESSLDSAIRQLASDATPVDLIIIAQARPGQYSAASVEVLRRCAPLAPLVALLGSWCDGETRSAAPWPGVTRVPWHQGQSRLVQEVRRLAAGELTVFSQPLTASAEERLLHSTLHRHDAIAGSLAVLSAHREQADWLAAACLSAGMSTVIFRTIPQNAVEGVQVVVWDAGLPGPDLPAICRQMIGRFAGAAVLALLDFPRCDDVRDLRRAGAVAVLAKPLSVSDLTESVRAAAAGRQTFSANTG
ncbi:MAG TPA: hypothetical protein VHC22_06000 [Pirellulales bacterium]|nr:hypothetical protein [Pirellulales bacterium]